MKTKLILLTILIIAALCLGYGCNRSSAVAQGQATASPTVTGGTFTTADLQKLRWIEGTWRGTGGGVPPFVERYKFESDSILAVESLEGEKFDKVADVTRFELKDGQFGGGSEGSRYVASTIDDKSITFAPAIKAKNFFRWERESENSWKAVISWPATDKAPTRERTYQMERWPKQ